MSQAKNSGEKPFIRRGAVDEVRLYEIKDHELAVLEKEVPTSFFINFGIALLFYSLGLFSDLLITKIDSDRTFTVYTVLVIVYIVIATIFFIGGLVLTYLWWRNRRSTTAIIKTIKSRIPDEATEPIDQDKGAE